MEILNDSFIRLNHNDTCTENEIDVDKKINGSSTCNENVNEHLMNDESSNKVRFIIGYISDDDYDNIDGRHQNDIIRKFAQELLYSTTSK